MRSAFRWLWIVSSQFYQVLVCKYITIIFYIEILILKCIVSYIHYRPISSCTIQYPTACVNAVFWSNSSFPKFPSLVLAASHSFKSWRTDRRERCLWDSMRLNRQENVMKNDSRIQHAPSATWIPSELICYIYISNIQCCLTHGTIHSGQNVLTKPFKALRFSGTHHKHLSGLR